MKTKLTLLTLFFIVFTISVDAAGGHRDRYNRKHSSDRYDNNRYGKGRYNKDYYDYHRIPDLSPNQRHKIDRICADRDRKIDHLNYKKKEYRRELNRMERSHRYSHRDIDRMRDRIYRIEEDIDRVMRSAESKIYSILTRHQRAICEHRHR